MQKVGVSICTHCMKETDEFCYYLPLLNVFFEVVENRLGHYMAVAPGNSNVKITIIGRPKMYKGLPLEFHVRCTKEGRTDEITIRPNKRVCPHCYRERREIRYLSSLTGYLPTYTIAIVGRPAVGKSGWTNSCIYGRGKKDTSRLARARQGFVRPVKLVATQMNERDRLIKEMFLTDRRGNEKTLILLCDTPGELLTQDAQTRGVDFEYHMQRVLAADALIYMLDNRRSNTENSWLSDIFFYTEDNHPIAVVMTKMDQLETKCRKNGGTLYDGDTTILTKDYFKEKKESESAGFYAKAKQMMVDKSIIRKLAPEIDTIVDEHKRVGYFTISSGTPDPADENILHHENAVGNLLPLEYILGCFGLYDYKRR